MSDQIPNTSRPEDEIDLGQLMSFIKSGLRSVFKGFLRFFIYLRSNIVILGVLTVLGLAAGFASKYIVEEKMMTQVIVQPNLESKHYLEDIVNEINGLIKENDTAFFSRLKIDSHVIENLELEIEDAVEMSDIDRETDLKFLEVLQSFENTEAYAGIIEPMMQDHISTQQRLTFFYKDAQGGPIAARNIIDYINNNEYFKSLLKTHNENAQARIDLNDKVIAQMDAIIQGYTDELAKQGTEESARVVLAEEEMNIADLFRLKNSFISSTELKRIELEEQKTPISVINFGQSQPIKKSLFGKSLFLIPFILVSLFLLRDIIRYFNRKSNELLS